MVSLRFVALSQFVDIFFSLCGFLWQRISIAEILEDEWFKTDYKPPVFVEKEHANVDDVEAVFKDSEVSWMSFK